MTSGIYKYIVIDGTLAETFDMDVLHKDQAAGRNATSAGFCGIFASGDVFVYGESGSLGLQPKASDADLIKEYLDNIKTYRLLQEREWADTERVIP